MRVVDEYERWLQSWASQQTTTARVRLARAFLGEFGLSGVTAANLQDFIGRPARTGKPKTRWSKATYHAHLKDLCAFLAAGGHIDVDPMDDVRPVKRPRPAPRPLTETEALRVLAAAVEPTRDWLLLAMLAGLRVSEIAAIRGEDVTRDAIYVVGKGDVAASLPCHPDLWEMAQRYPRHGYWFPGPVDGHISKHAISNTVGRMFHAMGISGSIHRCRHYYATKLLRSGVHVRRVQKLMRHANLETTAAYTAVDEDELRDAINLLPSLGASEQIA